MPNFKRFLNAFFGQLPSAAFLFASGLVLCGCGDKPVTATSTPQQNQYVQVHDLHQLMTVVLDPQADLYWDASATVMDENGEHDLGPKTDEEWLRTQSAAATLTEMGILLQLPLYSVDKGTDWLEFSQGLVEVGQQAEQAAINRNKQQILEVGMVLYNVCTACHQAYLTVPK